MSSCLNTYVWDWNMVLKLSPEYREHLVPLDSLIRKADEDVEVRIEEGTSTNKEVSDEDIVNFLHNGVRSNNEITISGVDDDDDWSGPKREPKMVMDSSKLASNIYAGIGLSSVPLLTPPKTVLASGSVIYDHNNHYVYTVEPSKYGKGSPQEVVQLKKQHFYMKNGKIGINEIIYWFDRLKNVTSEVKHQNRMMVYNLNTAILYHMLYIPSREAQVGKNKKWNKVLTSTGLLKREDIKSTIIHFSECLVSKFVEYIDKYVAKLVPDKLNYDYSLECVKDDAANRFLVEAFGKNTTINSGVLWYNMVQQRLGRRVDWIAERSFISSIIDLSGKSTITPNGHALRSYNKRLHRLTAALRKDCSPIRVVKTLLGKEYKDLYYKILRFYSDIHNRNIATSIIEMITLIKYDAMPKVLYHTIATAVNGKNKDKLTHLLTCMPVVGNKNSSTAIAKVESYIKLLNRLPEAVDWHIFNDTITMAGQLNMRLRINKFKTKEEVKALHDKFDELLQRNRYQYMEYDKYSFLNIEVPKKKYAGFEFVQLQHTQELVDEGTNMHHCVGGYSNRCLEGSLIFSMRKDGRSWATIQLHEHGADFNVIQKYTMNDITITNSTILGAIEEWRSDLSKFYFSKHEEISYEAHSVLYRDYQKLIFKLMESKDKEAIAEQLRDVLICNVSNYDDLLTAYEQVKRIEKEYEPCLDETLKQFVE